MSVRMSLEVAVALNFEHSLRWIVLPPVVTAPDSVTFGCPFMLRLQWELCLRRMDASAVLNAWLFRALKFVLLLKRELHICIECRIFLMLLLDLKGCAAPQWIQAGIAPLGKGWHLRILALCLFLSYKLLIVWAAFKQPSFFGSWAGRAHQNVFRSSVYCLWTLPVRQIQRCIEPSYENTFSKWG